ncbi:hypothetical protein PUN28_005566 [Cardiocondyla obscurior]|uniref:Uncharacterized protein n=1 Tax=Cardiocondyla obscurior TaxID=286306 RepID=A0AAW2GKG4_9HYME
MSFNFTVCHDCKFRICRGTAGRQRYGDFNRPDLKAICPGAEARYATFAERWWKRRSHRRHAATETPSVRSAERCARDVRGRRSTPPLLEIYFSPPATSNATG